MSTRSATIIRQTTYWGEQAETEELMRCGDCIWGKAVEQVGCVRFKDRGSDGPKEPDGFCAWGEAEEKER